MFDDIRIDLGIISHKPGPMLERCLQSLIAIPAGVSYRLLLQLTPGTNSENWNRLFKRCEADFICILEDDTAAIRPFWLKSMVETMLTYPQAGIVMPVETKDGMYSDLGFRQWLNKTVMVDQTFGFCNLIRKGVQLEADENLTYFVDIDLAYQARAKGWHCLCNGHVWLLHGSPEKDRLSDMVDLREKQEKDRLYLAEKWQQKQEVAA